MDVDYIAFPFQVRAPPHRSPSGVRGLFERKEAFLKWRVMDRLNPSGAFGAGVWRQLIHKDPPGERGAVLQPPTTQPGALGLDQNLLAKGEAGRGSRAGGDASPGPAATEALQVARRGRCRVIYWGRGGGDGKKAGGLATPGCQGTG